MGFGLFAGVRERVFFGDMLRTLRFVFIVCFRRQISKQLARKERGMKPQENEEEERFFQLS